MTIGSLAAVRARSLERPWTLLGGLGTRLKDFAPSAM
jgi:hypothetical protein